jgi:ABC-type antimicrobial peptide transport system permease subunit
MFKNYFKIAFRNLFRNKAFSVINICGLAVGMASAILILLWVQNELSFDRFYSKTNRLYMMYNRDKTNGEVLAWNATPKILGKTLKKDYPEVEDAARFTNITFLVSSSIDKRFNLRGAFTDPGFLSMFDFPLLRGKASESLRENNDIVLTEKLAVKLFGKEDPIGKTVTIDSTARFTVSAVLKDLPDNTSFDFEYLLPWSFMKTLGWDDDNWNASSTRTYTLLKPNTTQAAFDAKVKNIIIAHSNQTTQVFTQPVSRLHLYSKNENGYLTGGQIETVRLFSLIAAFILLIACINFMNLSTARSEKRAKEVGIRKVAGAHKTNLVAQFIGESVLVTIIAFVIAIFIVELSLPAFNQLTRKQLLIDYTSPLQWSYAIGFVLLTGLIAGSYPAFYLSSFMPVKVLKGSFKAANALVTPRKVLVVMQFSFAIILIISTVIVERQIRYAQNRDAGYHRENLIYAFTQGDADKNYPLIKQELLNNHTAVSVTKSANPITQRWFSNWGFSWPSSTESDKKIDFIQMGADADFVKTIGVNLVLGRDIDIYHYPTDTTAMLLNETAVKAMRLKDPLGTTVKSENGLAYHVVGVVKDFVLESPFEQKISPLMITGPVNFFQVIHIKLNPALPVNKTLAGAEAIFKKYNPLYPFEYAFADESYANKFRAQQQTGKLAALFAGLTIFISCLGLFGLASYMAENRIKEIGVRKILGASAASLVSLLSKDFLKLVLIAFLVAAPVAWYAMNKWLEGYTYRVNIEWTVFFAAGTASMLIALLTVSYQAIKAATANPVNNLRTE